MTRVYDALRLAERMRRQRSEGAPPAEGARDADPAAELERLRRIVMGRAAQQFAGAVERLEQRLDADVAGLRAELGKLEQRIESRLAEADARSSQGHAELREELREQAQRLGDRVKQRSAEAVRLANEGFQELRRSKLGANDFASFVRELARHVEEAGQRQAHPSA